MKKTATIILLALAVAVTMSFAAPAPQKGSSALVADPHVDEVGAVRERTASVTSPADVFTDKRLMMAFIQAQNTKVFPQLAEIYVDAILEASAAYSFPAIYLLSVMNVESNFDYQSKSPANCLGLMQINPSVWLVSKNDVNLIGLGLVDTQADLFDPRRNIHSGAFILSHYFSEGYDRGKKCPLEYAFQRYYGDKVPSNYAQRVYAALGES